MCCYTINHNFLRTSDGDIENFNIFLRDSTENIVAVEKYYNIVENMLLLTTQQDKNGKESNEEK